VETVQISYRSSAYDLAEAGEEAFKAKKTLASVKDMARAVGLDQEQTDIMVGGWQNARDDARGAA
jgi:hypothetical protein